MRVSTPTAVPLLGLLVVGPAFAYPQESNSAVEMRTTVSTVVPAGAVVDEITFVGLERIAAETAKSQLSVRPGEGFDAARLAADLRALNRRGRFEDVFAPSIDWAGSMMSS